MIARALAVALAPAVALAAMLAASDAHALDAGPGPKITSFTLENGLQVVVVEDHRAPVVTHMVWYRVGAADETEGKSGVAHFLEHLMFKGTQTVGPGEFSQEIAVNGGQDNAFTSYDYTAYHQRIAADRLGLVMHLEADRMANLKLTDAEVDPERQVVLQERAVRTDSQPASRLNEQVDAALYLNHPYGRPILGWRSEMEQMTRQGELDFYRRYYTPANAIVVVAGDVLPDQVRELAEANYGKIPNRAEVRPRHRPVEPPPEAERRVILKDARVGSPRISRRYLAPSEATAKPGEAPALDLLAEILGSGSNSRLYRSLVVDKGVAVDAGAFYQGDQLDYGEFGVYAVLAPDGDVAKAEAALDEAITDLLSGGVKPEELARAKTQLVADTIYARDSHFHMAQDIGEALTTGRTLEDYLDRPKRIEAATADEIVAAGKAYLTPERSVTGILLKAPAGTAGGRT